MRLRRRSAPDGGQDSGPDDLPADGGGGPPIGPRLTPAGYAVLATGAAGLGAGWGLEYQEALILGIAALAAVGAALLWTVRTPAVTARREVLPVRVARGDTAHGVVVLTNQGRGTLRGLRAEDQVAGQPMLPVDLPPVPVGGEVRARYRLPTERRGTVSVGPMMLVRGDPLGLVRRTFECGAVEKLLVRPRTVDLPALPAGRTHHLEGPTSDTAQDGTLTFHSLREYVLGDDMRRVHWRSSARTGRLMVRRMVDVSLPATVVVLDTGWSAYQDRECFETAVDTVASVVDGAARSRFPVRVITGAGPLNLGDGQDPERALDRLATITPDVGLGMPRALDALERVRSGDTLVVVAGTELPLPDERLARLRGRFDRMIVVRVGSGAGAPHGVPSLLVDRLDDLVPAWRREAMA
ncbi:DUF58 domain-containing protein [Yinghuangia soli]|uniref:DUF58 domain-containing protein n=1 Tax=Yinghuangia soli TaxID=2908204 RepID=A0AA41PXM9_9ACTN|nr:DUF58 domain-containing protein [Yinghuangia soli]MCF2526734.1 DUF58 domain-containing protein [Yinghuangia soli]